VDLVTRGHFRSHDKDGDHTSQSNRAENPMLHANFMVLCLIEPELLPMEVLHYRIRNFRLFCSCELDLDPTTFIYELGRIPWSIPDMQIWTSYVKSFESYRLTDRHTDKQTDRGQTDMTEIIYHAASPVVNNNHVEFNKWLHGNIQYI